MIKLNNILTLFFYLSINLCNISINTFYNLESLVYRNLHRNVNYDFIVGKLTT
jgi:hypothetical protein